MYILILNYKYIKDKSTIIFLELLNYFHKKW